MTAKHTRKYPSDYRNIDDWARQNSPGIKAFAKGLVLPGKKDPTPHYDAVLGFLRLFDGTDCEKEIWDIFRRWHDASETTRIRLEGPATAEGLTVEEYICREALKQLRQHAAGNPRMVEIVDGKRRTPPAPPHRPARPTKGQVP